MSLHDMLSRGYFPKELPRPFNTISFGNYMSTVGTLFGDFAKTADDRSLPIAKLVKYSHARVGLLRRQLALPNPVYQFQLSQEIFRNWTLLQPNIGGTSISGTIPEFKTVGRAINGKYGQGDRSLLARRSRIGKRYILKTDISRFYHSIYTHSIPWALHGKAFSKANRRMNVIGNRIDLWTRQGQDGQTIGIPIGPDTSLVISEMIMQKCDSELLSKIPLIRGTRFIDDYELSFSTRTEAEDAFHIIESCLSEYELALNAKKTEVFDLPQSFEPEWVLPLKRFSIRQTPGGQAADLEGLFDLAFSLHKKSADDSVLQYAIAKLRNVVLFPANWDLFQHLLYLCLVPEPSTLPYVLEQLITRINQGRVSEKTELESIVNRLIEEHSPLKHSSEVANALWAILAIGLKTTSAAESALANCDDSVVALLALDCEAHGLTTGPLNKSLWSQHMNPDGLYDEHWLLSYEANIKGWLPNAGGTDFVSADANFGPLKAAGVSFYDRALGTPSPSSNIPMPTIPTVSTWTSSADA